MFCSKNCYLYNSLLPYFILNIMAQQSLKTSRTITHIFCIFPHQPIFPPSFLNSHAKPQYLSMKLSDQKHPLFPRQPFNPFDYTSLQISQQIFYGFRKYRYQFFYQARNTFFKNSKFLLCNLANVRKNTKNLCENY